jgi:hypothetical protein
VGYGQRRLTRKLWRMAEQSSSQPDRIRARWLNANRGEATVMNLDRPNYFIHTANIILLVAYSVRDVLWLRLLAGASSLVAIPYFALQPAPLWIPIIWNIVFAAVNLFESWRLFVERRPAKLTAEVPEVRQMDRNLATLTPQSPGSWSRHFNGGNKH